MKASEVLRQYRAGKRDFIEVKIRGQSFKGQDLSGVNFSGADIRGTIFTNATLKGVNFTGAITGLQTRWVIGHLVVSLILLGVSSFIATLLVSPIASDNWFFYAQTPGITLLIAIAVVAPIVICYGLTTKTLWLIALISAITGAITGANPASSSAYTLGTLFSTIAGAVVGVAVVTCVGVGVLAICITIAIFIAFVGSAAGGLASAAASASGFYSVLHEADFRLLPIRLVSISFPIVAFGVYMGWRALKGDSKYVQILTIGVAFAAIGGTSFQGADLTESSFAKAHLKNARFNHSRKNKTVLSHVCWVRAQKLERARVGDSILANPIVRELLVTHNGYEKSYVNVNLRGANLDGVNLELSNLKGADLSGATLKRANFRNANLTETQVLGTDFTRAHFTGACLDSWNIDYTTKLDKIDCQFVFLLERPNKLGSRERRPHDPDTIFALGDFEKLYKKIMHTVQFLLKNGINREAFSEAFQNLILKNPELSYDSIIGIEKKDNDVLLTIIVPENSDKAKIARDFLQPYEGWIRRLESEKQQLQLQITNLTEITLELARSPRSISIQAIKGGIAVQGNNDLSRKIEIGSIGGDLNASGQALNLGEIDISGQVSNQINQLPDSSTEPDKPCLQNLLKQLKELIEADTELTKEEKIEALTEIMELAKAGQDTGEDKMRKLAKRSINSLKGILSGVADTSRIAIVCKEVFPAIIGLFTL
jgi:uncharacterized protein YjbI with pentapeptide repeats